MVLGAVGLGLVCFPSIPSAVGLAFANKLSSGKEASLTDNSDGDDWPAYGRTYGEQHFSPLFDVNDKNVGKLGLAWFHDLGAGNPASVPVAVNGVLYVSTGLSVVSAFDALTGRQLWEYDPRVGEYAGKKLRPGWGNRGISYWDGKVFTGTMDGRLIALDAASGQLLWSAMTVQPSDGRYISGPPRVFDGKIIIGHGGSDSANTRGYVTAYDASSGKQLWRFYIVPGNPADGFEDEAQRMAAATWTGEWWKYGGGGAAWNAFSYDPETDTVFVGTGNGSPWNQKIRSPKGGDNLFLCSILALDAKTGRYKWHYQINPGETWDYNAAMDMGFADIVIDGEKRKVLLTAPKNGFFYVIDRINGKFISAEKITKVTWAKHIDPRTGRPVEVEGARFPDGKDFELWPSPHGAHSWMPMAFSPSTGLAYIPVINRGMIYNDRHVEKENWTRPDNNAPGMGLNLDGNLHDPVNLTSALLAWNPVTQKQAWRVSTIGAWNGGVLATKGNLVFQGQLNGRLSAYDAKTGRELWHYDSRAPILASPITYRANGQQFITVLVGMGTSAGYSAQGQAGLAIDYHSQQKRILTFAIGGATSLPPRTPLQREEHRDVRYHPDAVLAARGAAIFGLRCTLCHGPAAISGGSAPDLRHSSIPDVEESFTAVVHEGALVANGMPRFEELSADDLKAVRQYILSQRYHR